MPEPRLVIASNRLPVVLDTPGAGIWTAAVGGLVTALLPVLRARGGTWVCWSGVAGDEPGIRHALASRSVAAGPCATSQPGRES